MYVLCDPMTLASISLTFSLAVPHTWNALPLYLCLLASYNFSTKIPPSASCFFLFPLVLSASAFPLSNVLVPSLHVVTLYQIIKSLGKRTIFAAQCIAHRNLLVGLTLPLNCRPWGVFCGILDVPCTVPAHITAFCLETQCELQRPGVIRHVSETASSADRKKSLAFLDFVLFYIFFFFFHSGSFKEAYKIYYFCSIMYCFCLKCFYCFIWVLFGKSPKSI